KSRSTRTPFDYLGATGSDQSLSFASLASQSANGAPWTRQIDVENQPDNSQLTHVRFSGADQGITLSVEYWFASGEGGIPTRFRASSAGKTVGYFNVFVVVRRKTAGGGWLPYRALCVTEGKDGKNGKGRVEILQIDNCDLSPPTENDFAFVLPLMCAL